MRGPMHQWIVNHNWMLLMILDSILIIQITVYGFLSKSLLWRYRNQHRMNMAAMASIKPVNVSEPWYVRTVDKVLYRWMN
jgi:hypothetical protein